ncbi:hypothetical protein [Picosynechococcus sp. PCC 7117]|uniref:hypothetical protein n=1 Tax=Picosynechococcus sp. PCC 7117 TaxID=195498 RepID=UPI0012EE31FB|nr:hypothetical protein [Picosynechococcus sp. PCC 7117]
MSNKKESWVKDDGRVVGKDTTRYFSDGSSKTTHQKAFNHLGFNHATEITGETHNHADGTSTHRSR